MTLSISRKIAIEVLIAVLKDKAYSNIAVSSAFSNHNISGKDKALATALVYGVLDRKLTIDYVISNYVKTPVSRIKPITLNAIRIAIYQIMFMDKIPDSAAVNESVNIVKSSKEKFNASFVNGVLRSYLREPVSLPEGNDAASLSIRYSCPPSIIGSFIDDYGTKTAVNLLEQSLKRPPITLRINTLKTDKSSLIDSLNGEGVTVKDNGKNNALDILSGFDFKNSKTYNSGLFHIEDSASQKVIESIGITENMRILDICSAPGGKAFTMAQLMNNTGEIVACDLYEHRVNLIRSGAKRLGITNINAIENDASVFCENLGMFDVVLCDVPCSGLGVIRRKPEIKYKEVSKKEFEKLTEIQAKILDVASRYVKSGGKLVYSTCTLKNAENRGQITAFLDKHSGFDVKYNDEFMPHIDGTDGFYCAILIKNR
ncbi:MAG: 16S rRNA (cytosine(967)-C(5))-methyltransferase RsmB [Clostridia bacterium]|nr:16S rRNA (cytosine(967)-C(5))-methyltransferase RsmB [Clostridia bacterium]